MSGVDSTTFGYREDAAVTDLEAGGSSPDTHTAMALLKGQVSLLVDMLDAIDQLSITAKQADMAPVDTALVTSVASAATSATLMDANASRKGMMIRNSDANALSVRYGSPATTSAGGRSFVIPADGLWEMPQPIYTGLIAGIWAADGSGAAEITEW